jgi:hypothetical protein
MKISKNHTVIVFFYWQFVSQKSRYLLLWKGENVGENIPNKNALHDNGRARPRQKCMQSMHNC